MCSEPLPAGSFQPNLSDAELLAAARAAREQAYAPYSHFPVGAALLAESGQVYLGCNIENASYPLSVCAERTAVQVAVAAGERRFTTIAIVADLPGPTTPCGGCRQVLAEFSLGLRVLCANLQEALLETTVAELLPHGFTTKGWGT